MSSGATRSSSQRSVVVAERIAQQVLILGDGSEANARRDMHCPVLDVAVKLLDHRASSEGSRLAYSTDMG
jgi:hypothetical protein